MPVANFNKANSVAVGSTYEICGRSQARNGQWDVRSYSFVGQNTSFEYISGGSAFGSATLEDTSGNGNNGTITSATWWKKDVDANYATPQLFKSDLGTQTGDVTGQYTDGTPYYASDDVFWTHDKVGFNFTILPYSAVQGVGGLPGSLFRIPLGIDIGL